MKKLFKLVDESFVLVLDLATYIVVKQIFILIHKLLVFAFNLGLNVLWYKFSVGPLWFLVVDVVAYCFLKLFVIDVDDPESSAPTNAAIRARKNFAFVNLTR